MNTHRTLIILAIIWLLGIILGLYLTSPDHIAQCQGDNQPTYCVD